MTNHRASTMDIEFDYLANHPEAIETISAWYENEWGYLRDYTGLPPYRLRLPDYLNVAKIPLMIVAIRKGNCIGTAQLKLREMDIYPQFEYWLGGVYVEKKYRGNNLASDIVNRITQTAKQFNISKLYLQTEKLDGGLYLKLGWQPLETVEYMGRKVLVMVKDIPITTPQGTG